MPTFAYTGRGTRGVINGEIDAPDRTTAVGELRNRAILVTKITEKAGGKAVAKLGGKVSDKEMAIFTRQFSTMVDAGLPLVQCLNILAEQSESKTLRGVTANVARQVEAGSTLADALRRHPRTFDDLFTNLVQVGETGGILDVVLQRLSVYIEKAAALKRKVKAAMIYPATIIGVAFLITIFMLTFVIPTFAAMFKGLGADLPLPTQIVLWLSDFVRSYILLIIAAAVGAVYMLRRYYRTENGKSTIDALLLKLPIFGTLIRKVAVARFTRTSAPWSRPACPSSRGCASPPGPPATRWSRRRSCSAVPPSPPVRPWRSRSRPPAVFPPMVTQMISVGEQTGALDAMLAKIADFYDDEVDTAVGALTALLEPLMIVVLGVIIGGLVVAMYLPIFRLVTLIK